MPASRFLKLCKKPAKFQSAVYLPVSTSRNPTVCHSLMSHSYVTLVYHTLCPKQCRVSFFLFPLAFAAFCAFRLLAVAAGQHGGTWCGLARLELDRKVQPPLPNAREVAQHGSRAWMCEAVFVGKDIFGLLEALHCFGDAVEHVVATCNVVEEQCGVHVHMTYRLLANGQCLVEEIQGHRILFQMEENTSYCRVAVWAGGEGGVHNIYMYI